MTTLDELEKLREIAWNNYQRTLTTWLNQAAWVSDEQATFLSIAKDEAEAMHDAVRDAIAALTRAALKEPGQ
jgi:hypothetical protein